MAVSNIVKNDIEGSITLADGTGTPVTHTVTYDRGDLVAGPFKKIMNEDVVIESRGRFRALAHGARIYPTGTFSFWYREFTNASGALPDMLLGTGTAYSANVSTLGAAARKYALKLTLTVEGTDLGDSADATLILNDCVFTIDQFSESREGNFIAVSFVCYGSTTGLATAGLS